MAAADGAPVSPEAVEHAARSVERRERKVSLIASGVMVALAASLATVGVVGIPFAVAAFAGAGRAIGRSRRARAVIAATADAATTWTLSGHTVTGRTGDREIALSLSAGAVRGLRALPAARVVVRDQPTSSTPPATER